MSEAISDTGNRKPERTWHCRFHPVDWFHEVGCPHVDWTEDQLRQANLSAQLDVGRSTLGVGRSGEADWFFSDPAAVARLVAEAHALRGKPFHQVTNDCVWLAERLHVASGSVAAFNFPRTPTDYSRHVHNDKILDYLRGEHSDPQSASLAQTFAELPLPEKKQLSAFRFDYEPPFMPGDLLIMRTGKGLYHMPVMITDRAFIQCAYPDGVSEGDILAPNYRGYLIALFRARKINQETRNP